MTIIRLKMPIYLPPLANLPCTAGFVVNNDYDH
jgi:hypothetical protein